MSTKSILLIDRDFGVRQVLHICFQDLGGWEVISVASIHEALEQLDKLCPDAIVLDIFSPYSYWFAFIRLLKQRPCTQTIPVLMITARASWFTPQQLQELGVTGAIVKPFDPVVLTRQVAKLLDWTDCLPPV